MRKSIISLVFLLLVSTNAAMAQSEAGLLFLLIQPSVRANGMGGASVASTANDALALAFNPAHIGNNQKERHFTVEIYPKKTAWLPGITDDLTFHTKTLLFSYDLSNTFRGFPLSIGAGFTRVDINFGKQSVTLESGPEVVGSFESWDRASIWTIGVGIDYVVRAGIGWNLKYVRSNLGPQAETTATAHDFGVQAHLPIFENFFRVQDKTFEISPGIRPFLIPGFGFTKSNIGGEIKYIVAAQADPLPRTARIGIGISGGLQLSRDDLSWRIFSFERLQEAEDILVRRLPDGSFNIGARRETSISGTMLSAENQIPTL